MKRIAILLLLAASGTLAAAEPVLIKPSWEVKLPPYSEIEKDDPDHLQPSFEWCRKQIGNARSDLLKNGQLIPPNFPTATGELVVVTTGQGQFAYALKADATMDPPLGEGELSWTVENLRSMIAIGSEYDLRTPLDQIRQRGGWIARSHQIYGNSMLGHHTVSNGHCYAIHDFGLMLSLPPDQVETTIKGTRLKEMTTENQLASIDLVTGKLRFGLNFDSSFLNGIANVFSGSFFLGSPISLNDRLYIINEKDKVLRLLVLDAKYTFNGNRSEKDLSKGVLATVPLTTAPVGAAVEFTRRIHALTVVPAGKLVLCPTHLGTLVAINKDDHKIAWTAKYGKPEDQRFENFSTTWRVTPPLVAGERVLYAPPDAEALFAFELKDGSLAWKRERGNGVFPAGIYKGKVLIVQKDAVVAVSVADGIEAWKVPFSGTLTGIGAFHGDRYYLPLGLGDKADEGALQIIDLKRGKAGDLLKRADKEGFGNLIVHQDKLISQTFEKLSVYPLE